MVGRDGIEPPTPGFSVLVCCALPRTRGYEEQNYQQFSAITIASDTSAYPAQHSQRHSQSLSVETGCCTNASLQGGSSAAANKSVGSASFPSPWLLGSGCSSRRRIRFRIADPTAGRCSSRFAPGPGPPLSLA